MLVRGGVIDLALADNDLFTGGNLVRHTLDLRAVGKSKAESLRQELNRASPHAKVVNLPAFPPPSENHRDVVNGSDLIVDCTGSDEVLRELATFPWAGNKRFISLSVGLRAQRLFCFSAEGSTFPISDFRTQLYPFLAEERSRATPEDFPREGIGCWNPVFPARSDDVWLLAAAAMKELEAIVADTGPLLPCLRVVAQGQDGASLIRQVSPVS